MPYSPLAIKPTTTANRHPLLSSAIGTAYLAYCPLAERAFLLESLRRKNDRLARGAGAIFDQLASVVERGYGLRIAKKPCDGSSIAVPIFADEHLAGVLSMTVFATLLNEAVHRFLDILHDTAGGISTRLLMASPETGARALR